MDLRLVRYGVGATTSERVLDSGTKSSEGEGDVMVLARAPE